MSGELLNAHLSRRRLLGAFGAGVGGAALDKATGFIGGAEIVHADSPFPDTGLKVDYFKTPDNIKKVIEAIGKLPVWEAALTDDGQIKLSEPSDQIKAALEDKKIKTLSFDDTDAGLLLEVETTGDTYVGKPYQGPSPYPGFLIEVDEKLFSEKPQDRKGFYGYMSPSGFGLDVEDEDYKNPLTGYELLFPTHTDEIANLSLVIVINKDLTTDNNTPALLPFRIHITAPDQSEENTNLPGIKQA